MLASSEFSSVKETLKQHVHSGLSSKKAEKARIKAQIKDDGEETTEHEEATVTFAKKSLRKKTGTDRESTFNAAIYVFPSGNYFLLPF